MKISPLAPTDFSVLPAIDGITLAAESCNIRYKNRLDTLLVSFTEGTKVAGVFTKSLVTAAPLDWCRSIIKLGISRALVVNAGNANAFTGKEGMESVKRVAKAASETLGIKPEEIFMASTGVIGEPLPDQKITDALPELKMNLKPDNWHDAARSIMTTDTFMKVATRTVTLEGKTIILNGVAKGSGMIAPNMATLLAFVFTDAAIDAPVLQSWLEEANEHSFNSITVDGDTSTNDTLLVFATGKAGNMPIQTANDPKAVILKNALQEILTDLAIQVVKDGEGAQKFITVTVEGAESDNAARIIALTIANSPLVKTAIAGEDANWGRIVGAAGRAGEKLEQDKIEVRIGGVLVAENGARVIGYDETPVTAHMKGQDIDIALTLGIGSGKATVYTCDLTHGYIDINGSYRS
jgi:glutamate N-acetyltransferase/amino-acid N-acetyltransferase